MEKLSKMKKNLLIGILFLIAFSPVYSQVKKDSTSRDTAITVNTPLLSIQDISDFANLLQKKFTIDKLPDYQELMQWLQIKIEARKNEWEENRKKKKL